LSSQQGLFVPSSVSAGSRGLRMMGELLTFEHEERLLGCVLSLDLR
jgi:hypothetical protein